VLVDRIAWKNEKLAQDGLNDFLATQIAEQMIPFVENGYSCKRLPIFATFSSRFSVKSGIEFFKNSNIAKAAV